jgi:hypothetical protein
MLDQIQLHSPRPECDACGAVLRAEPVCHKCGEPHPRYPSIQAKRRLIRLRREAALEKRA